MRSWALLLFVTTHRMLADASVVAPSTSQNDDNSWIKMMMPVILSSLAGLSTCLGAAIVFLVERPSRTKGFKGVRRLGDKEMCFSLALAASVMITVSVASILPESLTSDGSDEWVSIGSYEFLERFASFAAGCLLFLILSKCAFPEPDAILGLDDKPAVNETKSQENSAAVSDQSKALLVREISDASSVHSSISGSNPVFKQSAPVQRKWATIQQNNSSDSSDELSVEQNIPESDSEAQGLLSSEKTFPNGHCSCRQYSWSGSDLKSAEARRAWRVTVLLFVSLAVHNFPEGLAVAASTMYNVRLGWTTTIAIALHNIPEGIAIAVPCLAARPDSPCLAFGLASISGLAEPLGAIVAMLLLNHTNDKSATTNAPPFSMKNVLSFVAGIMITVAVLDLFPEALRHSKPGHRLPLITGTIVGVAIMLGSEAYLNS